MIDEDDFDNMFATTIHEMIHGLGFSEYLFNDYRDANGNVQDIDSWLKTFVENGHSIQKVVLPEPLAYARQTFQCDSLNGVAIENQGGVGTAGSHWKKLYYFDDFMNGVGLGEDVVYTKLTFSMLEASHWYRINYDLLNYQKWGRGKGCTFANGDKKCIENEISQMLGYICVEGGETGCSWYCFFI